MRDVRRLFANGFVAPSAHQPAMCEAEIKYAATCRLDFRALSSGSRPFRLRPPGENQMALVSMRRAAFIAIVASSSVFAQPASTIPARLSDRELWQLNADFSEPNGYFRSD